MRVRDALEAYASVYSIDSSQSALVHLLLDYLPESAPIHELSSENLQDFLCRWCIEKRKLLADPSNDLLIVDGGESLSAVTIFEALQGFLDWCNEEFGLERAGDYRSILEEAHTTIPRALLISQALTSAYNQRSGAFQFPDFLSTFEGGGRSRYDLDESIDEDESADGAVIEGYFRITSVESDSINAEDLMTDKTVGPITVPKAVSQLLLKDYVLELELLMKAQRWELLSAGFAYPPAAFAKAV